MDSETDLRAATERGQSRAAPDHAAPDHAAPDHAAPDHAAPDHAAPDHAGPLDPQFRLVDTWLREWISASNPGVGRTGPVCPFIPRALKQGDVEIRLRHDIDGADPEELVAALRAEITDFGTPDVQPRNRSGVRLESRVVVMPRLDAAGWARLDAAYPRLKQIAVAAGKMVGNFHPNCDDRAIRNPDFAVSVAPVAMVAIRHMAPHDILFLNDSAHWFREYDSRFHGHYARNQVRDPLLLSLYRKARGEFAVAA
jgi:hypothetical protein